MEKRVLKSCIHGVLLGVLFLATFGSIVPAARAEEISYPVSQFADGKAKFFEYKLPDGIMVKYFILKSSDGVIRAAFDACDVCWSAGKGYQQKGDFMVCRNCGRQFASTRINDVTGGCNPAALKRREESGKVVIDTADIAKGRKYFDFKGVKR
jgi:uncharacterized membrane protein